MVVKEKYEPYPNISYPMITISEIVNDDDERYFDETERVSHLAYQIEISATQSDTLTAIQNVRQIINIIDDYMKGDRYRCLHRIGSPAYAPLPTDNNIMVGYLRYECNLELDTNTIYRRY